MVDKKFNVDILLAAFNGVAYIDEQLQSIEEQTYPYWRIIVRDDGSNDGTIEHLKSWKKKLGDKMLIVNDDTKTNLGAIGNFELLIKMSTAEYIAFCDQDDYWLKNKLELFVKQIKFLEKKMTPSEPCVVFSDLVVVDSDLSPLANSLWQMQKINPNVVYNPRKLALTNCVTGCAMMVNRAAINISMPMRSAVMHDWWIALCVSKAKGSFGIVSEKTVLYRQHQVNVVGAKNAGVSLWVRKAFSYLKDSRELDMCYTQARNLSLYKTKIGYLIAKILLVLSRLGIKTR